MQNSDLICCVQVDQGSDRLRKFVSNLSNENFGTTIFLKYSFFYFFNMKFYTSAFDAWRHIFNLLHTNDNISRLFLDGSAHFRLFSLELPVIVSTPLFVIRQWVKLAQVIFQFKKYDPSVVILMDEAFGGILIATFCAERNIKVITNFTDDRFGFNIFTYNCLSGYHYGNRHIVEDYQVSTVQLEFSRKYMKNVFSGGAGHVDYSKTYQEGRLSYEVKGRSAKKRVLISLHMNADLPTAVDMPFRDFNEWYEYLRKCLSGSDFDVYVKDHPNSPKSSYHTKIISRYIEELPSNFSWISFQHKVDLKDFDLVLTCDGSISYEASLLGVPLISFARGNAEKLISTKLFLDVRDDLLEFLNQEFPKSDWSVNDLCVVYNWHLRHDISEFADVGISLPALSSLCDGAAYRCLLSIDGNNVVFLQTQSRAHRAKFNESAILPAGM